MQAQLAANGEQRVRRQDHRNVDTTLADLQPGPFQNRTVFNVTKMRQLAMSIDSEGLINWPLVRAEKTGYGILAGERRWRASCALAIAANSELDFVQAIDLVCKDNILTVLEPYKFILKQASITVRVTKARPRNQHHISIIENLQHEKPDPIDEGQAFLDLMEKYGYSINKAAKVVGVSDGYFKSRIDLVKLDPEIKALVRDGFTVDSRAIKPLLSIPDSVIRVQLAQRFHQRRTSVKGIEASCQRTIKLLQEQHKPQKVKIAQAAVKQPERAPVTEQRICPDCVDHINQLAEELCGGCSRGLTENCLHCPGVTEFINGLLRYTGAFDV